MKIIIIAMFLVGCMTLSDCKAYSETLVIPGSGNPELILRKLADKFNTIQGKHEIIIPQTIGTAGAIRGINEGTATLARVGRPLKDSERESGIVYFPIGRDPVVFVAGAGVNVGVISVSKILDVYQGKLTNWSELGGKPGTIRALGREVTDASRQAIGRGMNAFGNMNYSDNIKVVHLDWQMLELLDRFPTSLGFLNRSALMAANTRLVVLDLESLSLTPETIESGRYPFLIDFGLIYKENSLTPAGHEFLNFVKSPEGKSIMINNGVVPYDSHK